ncbi:MAG TPA: PIN domain-containing protein [Candidatus Binatia bacterium]|nr:PIN domain-containing protein [Candidatus Binatia bacterium]
MTLVDASVWIDHFRGGSASRPLPELLEAGDVAVHPFVHGELALGHLGRHRDRILRDLATLPRLGVIPDADVLAFVEMHHLAGSGIGWIDAHLLAAALHARASLWTLDRPLARVAARLGVDV